jgi:hypothetical protein
MHSTSALGHGDDPTVAASAQKDAMPRPMRRNLLTGVAILLVGFGSSGQAQTITSPGAPSLILSTVSENDIGKTTGERIQIIDDNVTPNSAGGTSVTATTTNLSSGLPEAVTLSNSPANTVFPDQFSRSIPYDSNLTAPWTLTVANGGASTTVTTPSLVGVNAIPFASTVTISGSSTNPTFSWQYPANSVNGVIINIYDKAEPLAGGGFNTVYETGLAGTTNSFTVPTALAGGLTLQQGTPYAIDIYGVSLRNPSLPISNQNSAAWSQAFFDFTPLPAGSPLVNLPSVTATGAYQYNMTVVAGQEVFIDPTIADGYQYQIGAGDPNFASVQLPDIQTDPLDVSYLLGGLTQTAIVEPGGTFDFPAGGVTSFDVTGIDPSLMLDPNDTTAFVTGLTFTGTGSFTGTQTPLTEDVPNGVPEPSAIVVLGSALAGLALRRRRHFSA